MTRSLAAALVGVIVLGPCCPRAAHAQPAEYQPPQLLGRELAATHARARGV